MATETMTAAGGRGTARVLRPAPRRGWLAVFKASEEATVYQRPEWLEACCACGDFEDASRIYETPEGRPIVVPMVRKASRPLAVARAMPDGWGFGGAIAPGALSPADVATVVDDLLDGGTGVILKPGPFAAGAWAGAPARARIPHAVHVVDLRRGFEHLWSRAFSSGTRNKIRKAEKQGVEVRWGTGVEKVGIHWDIYLRWAERRARARGVPVSLGRAMAKRQDSARCYEAIARCLGDRCQVVVASIDGRPVASSIVLLEGLHAHFWRSASDLDDNRARYANYLVLARVLEEVADRGHQSLDLGESGGVRSLVEFKEHFGAKRRQCDALLFGPPAVVRAVRARGRVMNGAGRVGIGAFGRLRRSRERIRRRGR